ncbi:MAG TPA: diiron oxygenase [Anaeromyxobacteraceae bacterium]
MPPSSAHHRARPQGPASRPDATTWDGLSRLAFATDWDPETAIDWSRPVEVGPIRGAWVEILDTFYAGEWQGLEIIQRLMNRASHRLGEPAMVTYYSTQCYDESKHLFVFRRYLEKLGARPSRRRSVDLLVELATRGPLPVERWIVATYFTETLAAAIFQAALEAPGVDATGRELIRLMLKDESRHIAGTRLGVTAVLRRAGRLRTALLRAWWVAFLGLAVKEIRKLAPHATGMGIDGEAVLRQTFVSMSALARFEGLFLQGPLARSFLSVNEAPPPGHRPGLEETPGVR